MIAGISPNSIYNPGILNRMQQVQQDFQQLGQDLQAGNLSAAQADFATIQQIDPQAASPSSSAPSIPINQGFAQLSGDLQSGNLASAQKDYLTLQQDFRSHGGPAHPHQHDHDGDPAQNPVARDFSQLAQMLQTGNQAGAQQAYSSLEQLLQTFTQNNGLLPTSSTPAASTGISTSA